MEPIKVAIVGVGNCAKSLVVCVAFSSRNPADIVGLMHPKVCGYPVSSVEFVAAFAIDERKVVRPLHEALVVEPNRTLALADLEASTFIVKRGPAHDSVIDEARAYFIRESKEAPIDVAAELKASGAEVVLCYLPTGSDKAAWAYAEATLKAGASFVNCMPTKIGRDPEWQKRFQEKRLVLLGDDTKSQFGATIVESRFA